MTPASNDLATASERLKRETADDHRRAERSDFQRSLLTGRLPKAAYVAWLQQLLLLYRELDALVEAWPQQPRHRALLAGPWRRSEGLIRDLADLGAPIAARPAPALASLITACRGFAGQATPSLLGVLYVLEGSTNGGRYLARSVRTAYQLTGTAGTAALDPYGDAQAERWRTFKRELDASVAPESVPGLVSAARTTFEQIRLLGEGLLPRDDRGPA